MSLSNKCKPPLGNPSTLNVGTLGVGNGAAVLCFLPPPKEKVVLSGVPMEASDPSGLDMERVRCFKLREDLFFLIPRVDPLAVLGELGASVLSFDMAGPSAGVAGETVNVVSEGLGRFGWGDGAMRLDVGCR
jgi:hypothetical protein